MVKMISRREYQKSIKLTNDFDFVWTHPDNRESMAATKRWLKENPTMATNRGDGKGWLYGKDYKFSEGEKKKVETKKKTKKKRTRGKSINTSGLTYEQKLKEIKKLINKKFRKGIPDNVTFKPVAIRAGKNKDNPDGLRLLVHIDGLTGVQSNFDYKGKFRIDACIGAIEDHAEK